MRTRLLWYAWSLLALLLTGLLAFPIRTGKLRLLIVILAFLAGAGIIGLLWKRRRAVALGILLAGILGAVSLVLPGRPIDPQSLQPRYLHALRAYDGTVYLWGGENALGIDCSGLVRRAMIDALFAEGWRTANPAAIRAALRLWWQDQSALALAAPSNGLTQRVRPSGSTATLADTAGVEPGDLAITASGSHVLAALDRGEWIEAEPGVGRTHIFTFAGPFADVAAERVTLVRWRWLARSPEN